MIYLASIPRCGSTYLFRSIAGLPQGGNTPPGAQAKHGIVKTHLRPDEDPRVDYQAGDRAIFVFGDVARAVVSTMNNRHDANHWANCGVTDYSSDDDLLEGDLLGYDRLFQGWLFAPFPVLFVQYEVMRYAPIRSEIEDWLGREVEWLPWRQRTTTVTPEQRRAVHDHYRDLVDVVVHSPSFFVSEPGKAA